MALKNGSRPSYSSSSSSMSGKAKVASSLKKTAYHVLSLGAHPTSTAKTPSSPQNDSKIIPEVVKTSPPLSSETQVQFDIQQDRLAQSLSFSARNHRSSPPIVDFTRFEDTYRGPRKGNYDGLLMPGGAGQDHRRAISGSFLAPGVGGSRFIEDKVGMRSSSSGNALGRRLKPALKRGSIDLARSRTIQPTLERPPDPQVILDSLECVLGDGGINSYIDIYELHQLDLTDGAQVHGGAVFGEPVGTTTMYASTTVVLGGRGHQLPIVVVHCVEELYKTGIYKPNLFRTLPNRSRLLELMDIFDSEVQPPGSVIRSRSSSSTYAHVGYGAATSLHLESTPDICALLTSYLSALPEPILPPSLFEAVWFVCSSSTPEEGTSVLAAQLVLHLLPPAQFSLLIYLLAFFSQVALVREENGVGVEDIGRMFGGRVFGHGKITTNIDTDPGPRRGEILMVWFLRLWSPISDTLFEVAEDARMGVWKKKFGLMRRDSLGRDVLGSPAPDSLMDDDENEGEEGDVEFGSPFQHHLDSSLDELLLDIALPTQTPPMTPILPLRPQRSRPLVSAGVQANLSTEDDNDDDLDVQLAFALEEERELTHRLTLELAFQREDMQVLEERLEVLTRERDHLRAARR